MLTKEQKKLKDSCFTYIKRYHCAGALYAIYDLAKFIINLIKMYIWESASEVGGLMGPGTVAKCNA